MYVCYIFIEVRRWFIWSSISDLLETALLKTFIGDGYRLILYTIWLHENIIDLLAATGNKKTFYLMISCIFY